MNKITLYLPESTRRRLREMARRTGRPQADLVRQALEGYLDEHASPLPSSVGSGSDEHLAGRNTERWFRASEHRLPGSDPLDDWAGGIDEAPGDIDAVI